MPHNLKLIITRPAYNDMQQIFDFIAQDNITAASDLLETFERQFKNIMLFPNCGFKSKKYFKRDVRVCVVAKHYQIFYYVKDNQLYIQRILTGYQDIFNI